VFEAMSLRSAAFAGDTFAASATMITASVASAAAPGWRSSGGEGKRPGELLRRAGSAALAQASAGQLQQVEDPVRFFTDLGEQADAEIEDRYLEYAGPDVPGESAEDKQARLTQAMNRAAEEVHAELVTPSPASQGEPDPDAEIPLLS
jgi:hypothetical protein